MKILHNPSENLVSVIYESDKPSFFTKDGETDISKNVQAFVELRPTHMLFVKAMLDIGATPTFEWVVDKNNEENLVFICLQRNKSGEFYSYKQMKEFANWFNIPLIKS